MKRFVLILLSVLYVMQLTAAAVLPGNNFFPGWKKSAPARFFKKADLFNHINGAAELFLEFGFEDLAVQRYMRDKEEISLELYRMENPTAALGIYLFKCGKEMPGPGIPARNSSDPYQIAIVKGSYFLHVNNPSGSRDLLPVMNALTLSVLKEIPPGEPVSLLGLLPARDLLPGSRLIIRGPYALQKLYFFGEGDILELKGRTFAIAGDYKHAAADPYTLILIPFADKTAAESAYRNLIADLDPYLNILNSKEKEFIFKDFQNKYGNVKIEGAMLRIKVNLSAAE
jgi:hypothetical protein